MALEVKKKALNKDRECEKEKTLILLRITDQMVRVTKRAAHPDLVRNEVTK